MWGRFYCFLPLVLLTGATPIIPIRNEGHFVRFSDLDSCPALIPRSSPPDSAYDVRPDDISVIMALGDSITAGLLARRSPDDHAVINVHGIDSAQEPLQPHIENIPIYREYRGLAYPIGGDPGAVTIANILGQWSGNLTGQSTGYRPSFTCVDGHCGFADTDDGLNVAVSGSKSANLLSQVHDLLLPRLKTMDIDKKTWKFVNIGIGGNDLCGHCLAPNSTILPLAGTPKEFARGVKDAVELLRKHVPNLIVNLVGMLRVSDLYDLTLKDPYCRGPFLPPVPHLPLECSCALLPGPAGDYTRAKMDALGEAYDLALLDLIRHWNEEKDPDFGVAFQPGIALNLSSWPIEALSPVDCFHPSEAGHQRVASGFWNRLTSPFNQKSTPIQWEDEVMVRCLEEDDRITIGLGEA